jgi:hypothetical protein
MPLLSYFAVIGSVLFGLLFLAEAQWGPGAPSRPESNPLHEQMAQRAERAAKARARTTAPTVGIAAAPAAAAAQASMAQGSKTELSATSRPAPAPIAAETRQKTAEKPAKKKKANVARRKDDSQRYARYHGDTGPRQYSIGYQ